jgi:hypothetical protein
MSIQDRAARINWIRNKIEEMIMKTGKRPSSAQLEHMANEILYEDLEGSNCPDKIARQENPILTTVQIKRRVCREVFQSSGKGWSFYG